MAKRWWLMKSEPEVFSFADLKKAPKQTTRWDGVRNYQARGFLRDQIAVGDGVLYYHSNAEPSGIIGLAEVVRAGYPDPLQFDRKSEYFDPDSPKDAPRWFSVDVRYDKPLARLVSLEEIKKTRALAEMVLLKRSRLSVQPVEARHVEVIVELSERPAKD